MEQNNSMELLVKEAAYLSKEHNVMAIMCCGSQNYGLDIDSSDFDTKAIVLPSFTDLVRGEKISTTVTFDCGLCDVKDVRLYIENLKKQNVNYVETLYTNHIIISKKYKAYFAQLLEKKDAISVYDKERSLKAMCGMLVQSEEKLKKSCDAGDMMSANKCYVNVFKCALMADKYIKGNSYEEVLDCSKIRALRDKNIPAAQMLSHASHLREKTEKAIEEWIVSDALIADTNIEHWLDEWILELLKTECLDSSAATESPLPKEDADTATVTRENDEKKSLISKVKGSVRRRQL